MGSIRKKYIDLSVIPLKGGICNKIDWKLSKGKVISGVYDGLDFDIKILDYDVKTSVLLIQYLNNEPQKIRRGDFQACKLGNILKLVTGDFKFKIGEKIFDDKRNLIILDSKKVKYKKYYKIKCLTCGFASGEHYSGGKLKKEYWINEDNIRCGSQGCPCCCTQSKIVSSNMNSMYHTDRWMVDLGVLEEDARRYTAQSRNLVKCICPNCGRLSYKKPMNIYKCKSIACICGDGFSYPEKFMYSVLKQLDVEFETEYSPKYLGKKRSDFYLVKYKLVIEMDGLLGHKGGYMHSASELRLEDCINSDKEKENMHKKMGIKTIRINCFKSDLNYIKKNILNSELVNYFNFSYMDWEMCDNFSIRFNFVKEVCSYWNVRGDNETTKDISKKFQISIHTAIRYLKIGTKYGWCFYSAIEESKKGSSKSGKMNGRKVEILKDGVSLGVYESATKIERISVDVFGVKLLNSNISAVISGRYKQHRGFTFKRVE